MEEPLLATENKHLQNQGAASVVVVEVETLSSSLPKRWVVILKEIKNVSYIAMPMVVTSVSQNSLAMVNMMMIGHLGELALSGAAIATSLANVTRFSLMARNTRKRILEGRFYQFINSLGTIREAEKVYRPKFELFS